MERPGAQAPQPPSLDSIRAQLRERGYLKGPLSRLEGWMVAGRGGPSSFVRINALASLRVGIVAGALLGIPAAAAVAAANRPHITSPRDLLLLSLYLWAVLGSVMGALEFLTDSALAWLSRRGLVLVGGIERLAGRVGLLFFVATTLYLAYLFRGGRVSPGETAGRGLPAWLIWGAAVVGSLAVGHVIGRLARFGSLMSLVAASSADSLRSKLARPIPRGRPWILGGLLLLVVAGFVVFSPQALYDPSLRASSSFEPVPLKGRIVLLGADGLDAGVLDRMGSRGHLPWLARLEREGARYDLPAEAPHVPPSVWTTIATGRPSAQHGILGYQADQVPGLTTPVQETPDAPHITLSLRLLLPPLRPARSPVNSGLRRERAIWEVLAEGGVQTAAVNWWATWPALAQDGIVVSERAFPRFTAGLPPDRDVAPEELQRDLAGRFRADLDQIRHAMSPGARRRETESPATSAALIDAYHALVGVRLLQAGTTQVLMIYLPGLDITRARALPAGAGDESVDQVARQVDRIAGDLATLLKPDDLLLIVGEPGRLAQHESSDAREGLSRASRGLLLCWGSRVVPGRRTRQVSRLDIFPTLLALAGFPLARDLDGRAVLDFLRVGDVATRLLPPIPSYGRGLQPLPGPAADPFDREVLDRLKSLGYIQ